MGISLRTRRQKARGLNTRQRNAIGGRFTFGLGRRAKLTTAMTGTNNDILLFAKAPGTGGNAVTFRIVVAGNSTPLSVSVAGSAITVNAATSAGGVATSTSAQVIDAVNRSDARSLVWAQLPYGDNGSGAVIALAATNLAGGS